MTVYGVPDQFVFRNGKVLGKVEGRVADGRVLAARVGAILDKPDQDDTANSPAQAASVPSAPPSLAAPLSAEKTGLLRLWIRHDFLRGVSDACGELFPTRAKAYQDAFQAWSEPRKARLNDAARLMLMRTSRADAAQMEALVEVEKKQLQTWQVEKLGISMEQTPTIGDCDRISRQMTSLE